MGLIAFMHDYEFVRLGFFVLQTSEHFVPLPPSPTLLLPSPEFALPVSSALALSRTGERKRKGEKESLPPIFVPLIGVLGSVQPPPTHSLTHPPALSCHVAPDREHCRHLSRSTIPPTILLFFLFLHRASSSPRFSVLLSVFPSSSLWCVAQ